MKATLLKRIRTQILYSVQPNKTFLVYFKNLNEFEVMDDSKDIVRLLWSKNIISLSMIHKLRNSG